MKQKEIKTKRLTLAPFRAADKDDLIRIVTDGEVGRTYMVPEDMTEEQKAALFERYRALSLSDDKFAYGIYKDGRLIGFIHEVYKDGNGTELGYVIDPAKKGNGYATEALSAAVNALFSSGCSAVIAAAFEENKASLRVMEKCGLKPTGETENIEYRGKTHKCIYMKTENKR